MDFLYFFALFTYGFIISPCYSVNLCIQMSIAFLSFSFHFSSYVILFLKYYIFKIYLSHVKVQKHMYSVSILKVYN